MESAGTQCLANPSTVSKGTTQSATIRRRARRYCEICHRPIPQARLNVLPGTTTCVKCASVKPYSSLDVPISVFAQHPDASQLDDDEGEGR